MVLILFFIVIETVSELVTEITVIGLVHSAKIMQTHDKKSRESSTSKASTITVTNAAN